MKRVAVFLAACVIGSTLATIARAQSIRVQAGEHADFTRLVLTLPGQTDWRLARTEDGYELDLGVLAAPFDLSTVFRIIPKSRLAAIWTDPATGRLRMRIACACHAVPFEFRPSILVIDLRDGPAAPGSPLERSMSGIPLAPLETRRSALVRPRPAPGRPMPRPVMLTAGPSIPGVIPTPSLPYLAPPPPTLGIGPPAPADTADLSEMRRLLVEELGRAASSGVIDVEEPIFVEPAQPALPTLPLHGPGQHMMLGDLPGLAAHLANDPPMAMTARGDPCLPDETFDILAWSDGRSFSEQSGELRRNLLGEFDRVNQDSLGKLARLHLYFAMGAEARDLISAFPGQLADAALLVALAHVMDESPPPDDSPLADQTGCAGPVALWSSLAASDLLPLSTVDTGAVSLAFSALPVHLRRHLGPALAEKLLQAGDAQAAQRVRDAIWRAPGDAGPAAVMVDGQLARSRGDLAAAEARFAEASRSGGPSAVRALVELVDARIDLGQQIDAETTLQIAALRHQHKGDAHEPALRRAEILAVASGGDFASAFELAEEADAQATAELWRLMADRGPDSAILDHAVLGSVTDLPVLDPVTAERVGTRLLDLGFADEALLWLPRSNIVNVSRAELARGDARAALITLAGETGEDAERIRAESLSRLGDLPAAAAAFAAAGDAEAELGALWRAQQWQAATLPEQTARQAMIDSLAGPPPGTAETPLASSQALVEDSRKLREAITALLNDVQTPAEAE